MYSAALEKVGPGAVIRWAVERMEIAQVYQTCWALLCSPAAALPVCLFVLLAYSILQHQPGALVFGAGCIAFMFVCMEQGRWGTALETCQAWLPDWYSEDT